MAILFRNTTQNILLWGSAAVLVTCAIVKWKQKKTKPSGTSKWKKVGEISELHIYPLKSGKGIQLQEAECTDFGLKATSAAPVEYQHLRDRYVHTSFKNMGGSPGELSEELVT